MLHKSVFIPVSNVLFIVIAVTMCELRGMMQSLVRVFSGLIHTMFCESTCRPIRGYELMSERYLVVYVAPLFGDVQ